MPTANRHRHFDRASLSAYLGAGAAIAFIAAMTIGAIETPSHNQNWVATAGVPQQTRVVSIAPAGEEPQVQ